jgi:hypothetical protein
MAKDTGGGKRHDALKKKDRDHLAAARTPGERGTAGAQGTVDRSNPAGTLTSGGQHHAAAAHGRPANVDTSLPATRRELLDLHAAARRRRNAAPLGSEEFRSAVDEIARIEVRIAAIDRAADPPLG